MTTKILALVVAVLMIVASLSVAFAAEGDEPTATTPTTYDISVNRTNDNYTHTYAVYQIYTGTPEGDVLTDIAYGSSFVGTGTPSAAELEAITNARAWYAAHKTGLGQPVGTLDGTTTTTYAAVPGWYLVIDTAYTDDTTDNLADAYSAIMMAQVTGAAVEFTPKKEVPSVDKEVNGAEAVQTEIGKELTFTLTATIPADTNMASYPEYLVQFNDTMSSGITFKALTSVTVNGTAIDAGTSGAKDGTYYTAVTAGNTGAWTLRIEDLKKVEGITLNNQAVTIVVTYTGVLNKDAVVSTASKDATEAGDNNNKVTLTYSNNPDATGTGNTGTTPEDHVWVFTFESDNTKVDKNGDPVAATFELYKVAEAPAEESKAAPAGGTKLSFYKVGTTYYVYNANAPEGTYPASGKVVDSMATLDQANSNAFNIKGLEAGIYVLHESDWDSRYVQANNTVITITATASETAETDLGKLEMSATNLNNEVVNLTGSTLPETGGIGTTIFYVAGSILVLAAAILLITKRRMSAND